jgi:PAS domain S-box-containing protein
MATALRKTGISVVGDVPWGSHFCYFYETKQDLLDIVVPYFKAGLEANEFCLWVISNSELLTEQEAADALRKVVPDLDRHLSEGSIELVPHDKWFLEGGTFDLHRVANRFKEKLDEALVKGYAGMRLNGSPAWLSKDDDKELITFEKEVDKLFPDLRIIASCTYPIADSAAAELLDVADAHRFVITRRRGIWEVLETPELVQAKQEIERLNEQLEQRVVERTRELAGANEELRKEIAERKRAEDALRRSEDHLRRVIDTIPTMAWSRQPDGIVDFLNQRWRDYTGRTLKEEIEEQMRTVHPEDIPRVMAKWLADMAAGEPSEDEIRLRRADGEYRWFLVRTAPLRDEFGRIIKWYGVSTDIDDRKRAGEQLKMTSAQLRALSARLSSAREEEGTRIARELHDELGAALTTLKWDLEGMSKRCSEPINEKDSSGLREEIQGMMRLVDEILGSVRRISSDLRPGILDDLGVLAAIEWQAKQFETRSGISCKFDTLVDDIQLDREQSTGVFRILQESLTNVLRHARATRVNILIDEVNGELVLEVRDNGRGITEDEIAGSLSLGLIGMRERAHLLGGRIEITGTEGSGTALTLCVPLSAATSD